MLSPLAYAGVCANRPGDGLRIEIVNHRELETKLIDGSASLFLAICGEGDDLRVDSVERRLVLFEVSQLLTAVASPMTAIEQEHCIAMRELRG